MDKTFRKELSAAGGRWTGACGLAMAMACFVWAFSPMALANEPDSLITGSLPGGAAMSPEAWRLRPAHAAPAGRLVVLGFAGDLGFSGDGQPLSHSGAMRHGREVPWEELMSGVAPLLQADVTFANLETVVTDRNDLTPVDKAFNFTATSSALKAAVRVGIDVLTAANNHSADYGADGIAETIGNLEAVRADGLKAHAGLGRGDARFQPGTFTVDGVSIGVAAIGKGINPAGPEEYGQPLYARAADFARVSRSLAGTGADIRVLSVHYNQELSLLPSEEDKTRLRSAADRGDATIIFGHHAHVASGVERRGNAVIFYGLGNFLHAGTQNMSRYGECRDFGIYARVYLWVAPGSRPVLRAVEVTPIRDMHDIAKPFAAEEAAVRISLINAMSGTLSGAEGQAMLFQPTSTGTGLYCLPGSADYDDALAARCRPQSDPIVNASLAPRADLASCKPLPQVEVARSNEVATPQPKLVSSPAAKKPEKPKIQVGKSPKKKPSRSIFLFSRAD